MNCVAKRSNQQLTQLVSNVLKQSHRKIKLSQQEIGALIDRFLVHSVPTNSLRDEEVLFEAQFKQMIGVLGNFFIGKRMFETILKFTNIGPKATEQQRYIRLVTYVEYSDILYHGTQQEKDRIGFMMLDLKGEGKIDFKAYEIFWINFLHMYGELLQVKLQYNEDSMALTRQIFTQLSQASGTPKQRTDGRVYFDFEDYQTAREQTPELFEWLDYPEQYVEQFIRNQERGQATVKLEDFEMYHDQVQDALKRIISKILVQMDEEPVSTKQELVQKLGRATMATFKEGTRQSLSQFQAQEVENFQVQLLNRLRAESKLKEDPSPRIVARDLSDSDDEHCDIQSDHHKRLSQLIPVQKPAGTFLKSQDNLASPKFTKTHSNKDSPRHGMTFGEKLLDMDDFNREMTQADRKLGGAELKAVAQDLVHLIRQELQQLQEQAGEIIDKSDTHKKNQLEKRETQPKEIGAAGGKFVRIQSQNFDIIMNILIGIRRSISSLTDIPGKAIDDHEYAKQLVQENDWVTGQDVKNNAVSSFKFYDYAPLVFQRIRSRNGIQEDDYIKSLGPEQILNSFWTNNFETLYELCSSGQSGSLFYYTKDRKYMMKTIPLREFTKMREVLKGYYQHMKAHPDSLLIRFYGLHQVQWRDSANTLQVRFLTIMDNIFKAFEVGLRFDLKGSTQGRTYLKPGQKPKDNKNVKTALKDNDFIQHVKYIQFQEKDNPDVSQMLTHNKPSLMQILSSDADFLAKCAIIDYSLLLGEIEDDPDELRQRMDQESDDSSYRGVYFSKEGKPYVLGIIDPLTGFNFQKSIEFGVKRLRWGTTMSCVPPRQYADRFKSFMQQCFSKPPQTKK